jgi:hypothetical protein
VIRVTIQLISAQNGQRSTLGVMDICNTGESMDPRIGHYTGRLYRKGTVSKLQREGKVQNWPRKSYTVWRLVLRMLQDMHPEDSR